MTKQNNVVTVSVFGNLYEEKKITATVSPPDRDFSELSP